LLSSEYLTKNIPENPMLAPPTHIIQCAAALATSLLKNDGPAALVLLFIALELSDSFQAASLLYEEDSSGSIGSTLSFACNCLY
jgi:hypothetical protein